MQNFIFWAVEALLRNIIKKEHVQNQEWGGWFLSFYH